MNSLITLPILIPLLTAITTLFAWHKLSLQRLLTLTGCFCFLIDSFILLTHTLQTSYLVAYLGNWPAPFGITLVSDILSSSLIFITAIIAFCVALYTCSDIDRAAGKAGFYPAYCILLAGVSGAFLTGDLFNLYVWFEVILISSFILLSLNADKKQLEGSLKYAVLNLIATLILLTAIAFLYGMTGTLNMADLSIELSRPQHIGLITTISVIFIIAFGTKAALFPLFFWLPAAYPTPHFSTSAIFAGLLSKVGVYALIRTFTLFFLTNGNYLHNIILILSLLTLIIGILIAIAQIEIRRIFSFSLISHIGFMTLGLALFTPLALIGSIFYLLQHMLVKTQLFLCSGLIQYFSRNNTPGKAKDFYQTQSLFSILFFIAIFSLAGLPPSPGFWAKFILLKACFQMHNYFTLFIVLIVSFLTLFLGARIWQTRFLETPINSSSNHEIMVKNKFFLLLPTILLTAMILLIGVFPAPIYHIAQTASDQLFHPDGYVHAVLNNGYKT